MRNKKIIISSVIALGGIWLIASAFTSENENKTSETQIVSSEGIIESGDNSPVSAVSANSGDTVKYVDLNENGIPDVAEDYYNDNIRDKYLFGISLGSLIGFTVNLFFNLVSLKLKSKYQKQTSSVIAQTHERLLTTAEFVNQVDAESKKVSENCQKLLDTTRETLEKYQIENKQLKEALNEATIVLSKYENFNAKLNVIIKDVALLSETPEYVKSGVSERIHKSIEEVS